MALHTNRHMDEEEIERYSMGEMPEEEVARFEEHLLICESCQRLLEETDVYVSSMERAAAELRREPPERQRRAWFLPRLVPALAAVAVVALIVAASLRFLKPGAPAPAVTVSLEATRGTGIGAKAPAGRPLDLHAGLAGLPAWPTYRLEMVDSLGNRVWQGAVAARDSKASATVPPAPPGVFFIRVYSPSGELLREYGLEIERQR